MIDKIMFNQKIKTKKGSILAYVLVMMAVVSIILVSMLQYISAQLKFSYNRVEREQAFRVAEAGVGFYRWYLAHELAGKSIQQIRDFWQTGSPLGVGSAYEADFKDDGDNVIGSYKLEVVLSGSDLTTAQVKSTGWAAKNPSIQRSIEVRFRRPPWSQYMFLVNEPINFANGAEIFGKVHSNSGVRFDGIAHDVVSSLVPSFDDPTHGGSDLDYGVHTHISPADGAWPDGILQPHTDVFMAGRDFPVSEVDFSAATFDFVSMKSEAQAHGVVFNDDGEGRRIILKSDGRFDVCIVKDFHHTAFGITKYWKTDKSGTCNSCAGECLENYEIPDDNIIFVEDNAWVEGVVNGKNVTILAANLLGGTPADIFIGLGDISYSDYNCDNSIGLAAQRNITIIRDCQDDFKVDAALLAQIGRLGRSDYGFSSKNSITFNGAIVSYLRPIFNHGASGFTNQKYNFDINLLDCPPPFFPTGTEYSMDSWNEL